MGNLSAIRVKCDQTSRQAPCLIPLIGSLHFEAFGHRAAARLLLHLSTVSLLSSLSRATAENVLGFNFSVLYCSRSMRLILDVLVLKTHSSNQYWTKFLLLGFEDEDFPFGGVRFRIVAELDSSL